MRGLGTHTLVDFYGCDSNRLNDLEFLREVSLTAVDLSGATILGEHFKYFEPQGVSGVIIIAESHFSMHSWPEHGYIGVDYFTCGDRINIDAAISHLKTSLSPRQIDESRHIRGKNFGPEYAAVPDGSSLNTYPLWFTEFHRNIEIPGKAVLGYQYLIEGELARARSRYQDIRVMENPIFGRMLIIDDNLVATEKDKFVYHEMLAHVPMILHGSAHEVLIISGGEGGLLHEVDRHPSVSKIDMVALDPEVVEVARQHLPSMAQAFNSPKANLHFGDAAGFVKGKEGAYDVILVDSTDPVGADEALFLSSFFKDCQKALKESGIFAGQALSPWLQEREQEIMFSRLASVWESVFPYTATIPSYPGGLRAFALASDGRLSPDAFDVEYADCISRDCRYYNADIHKGSFRLPNFMKQKYETIISGRS